MSRPGDFNKRDIRALAEAAGHRCANCCIPTSYYDSAQGKRVGHGHAAHNAPASPRGPLRPGIPDGFTLEQTKDIKVNAAHLCPNCARLVDVCPDEFPFERLRSMQENAEERQKQSFFRPGSSQPVLDHQQATRLREFIQLAFSSIRQLEIYGMGCQWSNDGRNKASSFHSECSWIHMLNHRLCAGVFEAINLQVQIVESVGILVSQAKQPPWSYNPGFNCYELRQVAFTNPISSESINAAINKTNTIYYYIGNCLDILENMLNNRPAY